MLCMYICLSIIYTIYVCTYIDATKYDRTPSHRIYTHTQIYINMPACLHITTTSAYNNEHNT